MPHFRNVLGGFLSQSTAARVLAARVKVQPAGFGLG
jgi:hypothetical protein